MAADVVLVHGAWHGAWCFDRVAALLTAAGVRVVPVDLPGHGSDSGAFTDLHGDADRVRVTLDELWDVVLLGHSYGGAVITEAGDHPAVRHLVYLAAFPLDHGETCGAAAVAESAHISHEGRPDLGAFMSVHDDGTTTLKPGVEACLYQDCTPADAAWALARLEAQPMRNLAQVPARFAWRHRPSTYVVCADDLTVHPDLQRILARRCTTTVEWPTGHSPFLSRPQALAELLLSLT